MQYCGHPRCSVKVEKGRCAQHAVQREHQRFNYDVRKWYRTARWLTLRTYVLHEEPLCVECHRQGRTTPSTQCDHIRRHGGDEQMFFDRNNLQGLCASCHSAKTARGE